MRGDGIPAWLRELSRGRLAAMILFVSGATKTMKRFRGRTGELIVPGSGNAPDALALLPGRWAMDNGAFSGFNASAFMAMLQAFYYKRGCRFVTAPDAVGDAYQTLKQWPFWRDVIRGAGFPPAFVAQDGVTVTDVPWPEIATLFIGGHTEWKLGQQAQTLIAYAKSRGLWVHMGRVNSQKRIWEATRMGCDSFDGSGFSRWADIRIPIGVAWSEQAAAQNRFDI